MLKEMKALLGMELVVEMQMEKSIHLNQSMAGHCQTRHNLMDGPIPLTKTTADLAVSHMD
jgi:hypothetical protein